jgi:beta-glucosidase
MVLLKNNDSILPLRTTDSIAIIGQLAKTVRYQGGGSSHINPYKVDSMLDFIPNNVQYDYADGYDLSGDGFNQELIDEARRTVINKDKVILVVGLTDIYESEGYDRTHLNLPLGHLELLKAISQITDNIVVVLQLGSPIIMPWIDHVKGVLNAYLAGEAGAKAIIELLYGLANPSGRLAETYPMNLESHPSHDNYAKGNGDVSYQESIYVGYRYYSSAKQSVLFPFGYGLSYSSFAYSNLVVEKLTCNHPGKFTISVDVKNTGFWVGKEVVQVYISAPQKGVYKPIRELKAFSKIEIQPSETKTVTFTLSTEDFGYYDLTQNGFVTEDGFYQIQINRNADEVILEKAIKIENPDAPKADESLLSATSYSIESGLKLKKDDFERILGHPVGEQHIIKTRPFDVNNTIEDIKKTFLGHIVYQMARKEAFKQMKEMDEESRLMVERSLNETPIRAMVVFSGGILKMKTMMGLLELINHHPGKAIKHFFGRL